MPRGRKPQPTRLKIALGNPGKRPLNDKEPMPQRGVPECPEELGDIAKRKWAQLVPELDRLGLLTVIDGDTLACYCQAWDEFLAATRIIAKEGGTVETMQGGEKSHPAIMRQRTAWKAIKDFASLFGLDPSSRSRLQVPPKSEEEDEFNRFLGEAK